MNNKETSFEFNNISFKINTLSILNNVNLKLYKSEVHALVGEHGAGKTSLCLLMSGFLRQSAGSFFIHDNNYDYLSPKTANNLGIELVPQRSAIFDNLTVSQNILGDIRSAFYKPFINRKLYYKDAEYFIQKYDFNLDPNANIINMNLSDRILVEILRHVYKKPKLLILDEALQKISSVNLLKIIKIINELKEQGTTIFFVTHRIDDIYEFADRVSIIRNGDILITDTIKNIDKITLIKLAYTQISNMQKIEYKKTDFLNLLKYIESILQDLPLNIIVVDRYNRIKMINKYAKTFFRIRKKEYLNMLLKDLFKDNNFKVFDLINDLITSNNKNNKTLYNIGLIENGKELRTNIKVNPIYDADMLIGHAISIEDITEQEIMHERLILSEKLSSIGLLAAGVAHEINNPLEIIYNHIQFLRYITTEKRSLAEIELLENEIDSISQIVSNLITFSDHRKVYIEIFNVNELIDSIINLVNYHAKHSQIDIQFEKKTEPLQIAANKTEIKQVILNLIKNSFEAMPGGGNLTIKTQERKIEFNSFVEITVKDTGIGVENNDVKNIFLPFYSTKDSTIGNMGLGLSISYGIIKKYKGNIYIEKNKEKGCCFKILLPKQT